MSSDVRATAARAQLLNAITQCLDSESTATERVRAAELRRRQQDASKWFLRLVARVDFCTQIANIIADRHKLRSQVAQVIVGILNIVTVLILGISTDVAVLNSELLALGNDTGFVIVDADKPVREFSVAVVVGCIGAVGAALLFIGQALGWDTYASNLKDVAALGTDTIKHLKQAGADVRKVGSVREHNHFLDSFNHREFSSVVTVEEQFRNLVPKTTLEKFLPKFRATNVSVQREIVGYRADLEQLRGEERQQRRSRRAERRANHTHDTPPTPATTTTNNTISTLTA